LSADDPESEVRALDPIDLLGMVGELSDAQARPLLVLCSPEQAQALVDFHVWRRDRVDRSRLGEWLERLLELPLERLDERRRGLDSELVGLFLVENLQIYFREDEEDAETIDRIDEPVESTPDGYCALVMPSDETLARRIRRILQRLYAADPEAARQLLQWARWELPSQMEEEAYRVRSGRLEGHGFLPPEEAVEIYARTDPSRERERARRLLAQTDVPELDTHPGLEPVLPRRVARHLLRVTSPSGSFFGRALLHVCESGSGAARGDALLLQLGGLLNRALVADRGEPGDLDRNDRRDRADALFSAVHGWLNLGLEYLADRELARAGQLLVAWPLKRVFQTGYNLAAALAHQARSLIERGNLTLVEELPDSLCQPEESELLAGLTRARPRRRMLPEGGAGAPFESLAQLEQAAAVLTRLAYKELWTFAVDRDLGDRSALLAMLLGPPGAAMAIEAVTFDALLATGAALLSLGHPGGLRLLRPSEVVELCRDHVGEQALSKAFAAALRRVAATSHPAVAEVPTRVPESWAGAVAAQLVAELGGLSREGGFEARLASTLLLVERAAG
jgi:hypothetical protein